MNGTNQNQSFGKSKLCYYFIWLTIYKNLKVTLKNLGRGCVSNRFYVNTDVSEQCCHKVHFQLEVFKISKLSVLCYFFPHEQQSFRHILTQFTIWMISCSIKSLQQNENLRNLKFLPSDQSFWNWTPSSFFFKTLM